MPGRRRDARPTRNSSGSSRSSTEQYQGAANAGRPLVLEGGLDWKAMSLSPKDMDFMEAKHAAAREIALAFGVPPMLLAIPGDNTYANYQEANRVFWRQTVLPLAARIACALTQLACAGFRRRSAFSSADTDRVEALSSDRAALWERVSKRDIPDRQREAPRDRLRRGGRRGRIRSLELLSCGEVGEFLTPAGGAAALAAGVLFSPV